MVYQVKQVSDQWCIRSSKYQINGVSGRASIRSMVYQVEQVSDQWYIRSSKYQINGVSGRASIRPIEYQINSVSDQAIYMYINIIPGHAIYQINYKRMRLNKVFTSGTSGPARQ